MLCTLIKLNWKGKVQTGLTYKQKSNGNKAEMLKTVQHWVHKLEKNQLHVGGNGLSEKLIASQCDFSFAAKMSSHATV